MMTQVITLLLSLVPNQLNQPKPVQSLEPAVEIIFREDSVQRLNKIRGNDLEEVAAQVPTLAAALKDRSAAIQEALLKEYKDADSILKEARKLVEAKESFRRASAYMIWASLSRPIEYKAELLKGLSDESARVRVVAAAGLARASFESGKDELISELTKLAEDSKASFDERFTAASSLNAIARIDSLKRKELIIKIASWLKDPKEKAVFGAALFAVKSQSLYCSVPEEVEMAPQLYPIFKTFFSDSSAILGFEFEIQKGIRARLYPQEYLYSMISMSGRGELEAALCASTLIKNTDPNMIVPIDAISKVRVATLLKIIQSPELMKALELEKEKGSTASSREQAKQCLQLLEMSFPD